MKASHSKRTDSHVPDLNLSTPRRPQIPSFHKWKSRFRNGLDRREARKEWNDLLGKGCKQKVLARGFFWAMDFFNSADEDADAARRFDERRASALDAVDRLVCALDQMKAVSSAGVPTWLSRAAVLKVEKTIEAIKYAPRYLQHLQKALNDIKPTPVNLKSIKASIGPQGEVWLQLYVKGVTGSIHRRQVSVLLDVAAEAYGRVRGWGFSEEDVAKRFSRYTLRHPEECAAVRMIVSQFLSERQPVDVISYLRKRLILPHLDWARRFWKADPTEQLRVAEELLKLNILE